MWLQEAIAWKCATKGINSLKRVHGFQLALYFPEGSEIRQQIFDTFDNDEKKCENGWNAVTDLLTLHLKKVERKEAVNAWK